MKAGAQWAIAVHGGAGAIPKSRPSQAYVHALHKALDAGHDVLENGMVSTVWDDSLISAPPLALGAALAAVEYMEECPLFNAGHGAVLNNRGFCENEASVMDGATMRTGAACGRMSYITFTSYSRTNLFSVRTVKFPSRLAMVIFTAADFQHLGFSAAERYADRYPTLIARAEPDWFITDNRKASLRKAQEKNASELDHGGVFDNKEGGTVGATVCDGRGNVAVVTSTGGVTNKWEGRIGDTPIIGAGSYASNKSCAVSGTGWGEQFIRYSAGSRVSFAVEYGGMTAKDAMYEVVHNVFPDDTGGFVGVTPSGEVVMDFNSAGMYRGCRNWEGQDYVKIWE